MLGAIAGVAWYFASDMREESGDIVWGDDSGSGAGNGVCDDPRFTGAGMAMMPSASDMGRDASDCRDLYFARGNWRRGGAATKVTYNQLLKLSPDGEIAYGDDTSSRANDGVCQDLRFASSDMVLVQMGSDIGTDASDCRSAVEEGRAQWVGDPVGSDVEVTIPEAGAGGISFDLESELEEQRAAREGE